jgi:hypothetical protein
LEVIYRILKDQLRRAKHDLLDIKREASKKRQAQLELKRRINAAKERAALNSSNCRIITTKNNTMKLENANDPAFKKVARHLLAPENRKSSRFCSCCRTY